MSREYTLTLSITEAVFAAGAFRIAANQAHNQALLYESDLAPSEITARTYRNQESLYNKLAQELEDQYRPHLNDDMDEALRKAGL